MGNLQRFDVKDAIDKKNIEYFMETGTLHGDSLEFVDGVYKFRNTNSQNLQTVKNLQIGFRRDFFYRQVSTIYEMLENPITKFVDG